MCDVRHHGPEVFAGCFPFGHLDVAKMKRMAGHFMKGFMGKYIPYNVEDLGELYLITVPLAGRTKEDITVSLINKHLNIKATKPKIPEREKIQEEPVDKKASQDWGSPFFWKGFTFIKVDMDITLPDDADADTIVSKMVNGLLKITLRKKPAKKIDINEN